MTSTRKKLTNDDPPTFYTFSVDRLIMELLKPGDVYVGCAIIESDVSYIKVHKKAFIQQLREWKREPNIQCYRKRAGLFIN